MTYYYYYWFTRLLFKYTLHPLDRERFAFSLPYPNHTGPHKRYQWTVLPQGTMNSPTMCQYYIAKALEPVRKKFPNFLVIHYMDDILFSALSILETQHVWYSSTMLKKLRINNCPWKIQTSTPYHSVQFSHSVVSHSLRLHEWQHARPPCPSPNFRSSLRLTFIESLMPTFSLSTFTFIKRLLNSYSLSAISVVSSAYLRLLIFLPAILIPACASSSPVFLMMYSA